MRMEHFEETEEKTLQQKTKELTAEERREALRSINQECFFEYDIYKDIMWLSREGSYLGTEGVKVSNFSEKLPRTERIYEEDIEALLSYLHDAREERLEFRYVKEDGSYIWCAAKGAVIKEADGSIKAIVGNVVNIDQEKRMHEMLVEQSLLDPLTKLYSKTKAQNMIESFIRTDGSFGKHALLLVNICGFSEVNKRFGSVFGDGVLVSVAERLQKCFRKKDIVARVGGDDFLVLVKDISHQEALLRKMRQVVMMMGDIYGGEDLSLSCNVGAACFPQDGRNYGSLFRHADCALYKARKSGNEGFELYDSAYQIDEYNKRGEFYHEYVIREDVKNSRGDFNREITDYAVEIMLDAKDVASAIKMLLDKVGKYYKCDTVQVWEKDDNNILHTSYSWNDKDGLNHFNSMQFIDLADLPSMRDYFDQRGLRIFNNTNIMRKHPGYASFIEKINAKALLQCAFYDGEEFKGCICIGHEKKTHEWMKDEINALLTITKLLSVYLLKLKSSEKIQHRIDYLTNYDSLTKLSSQNKFRQDVMEELEKNSETTYAIVYMDINKFKYINDALGYDAGDDLLREMARTVSGGVFDILYTGRVSSDNFVLLMNYVSDAQIQSNLEKLNESFIKKINFCSVGKSIYIVSGVAKVSYGQDVLAAMDNANLARKSIKKENEIRCCFYDDKLKEKVLLEMDICNSMQQALDDKEFVMYLQPKVNLENQKIVGAEALTRWIRKDGRMMFPDQFIPLFEKNGFIISLDFYIYECACKALRRWIDQGISPVTISLNVSRVHLNTDNFVEKVLKLVDAYSIPHHCLEFELTESIFLDDTNIAIDTMKRLRSEGFYVSIDDFGAGFSSLNLLKDMTSDVLKLDKEFFRKGDMKNEEKIIVSSITNMAKQLKMKVLSEGVETEAQSEFLKDISCDMAQGYLFAKPMPVEEFTELLLKNNPPVCESTEV